LVSPQCEAANADAPAMELALRTLRQGRPAAEGDLVRYKTLPAPGQHSHSRSPADERRLLVVKDALPGRLSLSLAKVPTGNRGSPADVGEL
jgi:hypothetical protein